MAKLILSISKMTPFSAPYFRYFPPSAELLRWGIGVAASGLARTPAGAPYPPDVHPADHHFNWNHGRVLESLQILLITSGRGWLETRALGRRRVEAGMAFLLLPQTWHRYRPDPKTGWEESWIEVRGPVVDSLVKAGTFPPASVLRRGALDAGLEEILRNIHRRAAKGPPGFQPEWAAAALQALALFARITPARPRLSRIQQAVEQAERRFNEHPERDLNLEAFARELGVAYSHFRRAFRAQTGYAPWQYILHLRLARARRLLASGDATLEDIAARVGFASAFHLSRAFKQSCGQAPAHWRRQLAQKN
jgi:AraC-like DNA-binding protein